MAFLIGFLWLVGLSAVAIAVFMLILRPHKANAGVTSAGKTSDTGLPVKKYESASLHKYKSILFLTGLMIALIFAIIIFEYTVVRPVFQERNEEDIVVESDELREIPVTELPPPEPPKVQAPEIVEVEDDEVIEEIEKDFDQDEPEPIDTSSFTNLDVPEEEPTAPSIMDYNAIGQKPEFPGGQQAMMQAIVGNYNYPNIDREQGNGGMIMMQFVVGVDGNIRDVKVMRGINERMDKEAVRVIENLPKWKPGKNAGNPVPVRMMIPIRLTVDN